MSDPKSPPKLDLKDVSDFLTQRKTIVIVIGLVLFIFIFTLIFTKLYYYFKFRPYLKCNGCFVLYNNSPQSISGLPSIPFNKLLTTTADNIYAYSMWLNISNWYHNYGKWKHVYHHGSPVSYSCMQNLEWDNIQHQSPGVWFGSERNDIRIVISTTVILPTKCLNGMLPPQLQDDSNRNGGATDASIPLPTLEKEVELTDFIDNSEIVGVEHFTNPPPTCDEAMIRQIAWMNKNNDQLKNYLKDPDNDISKCNVSVFTGNGVPENSQEFQAITLLEYVDFQNVPIGQWFQIGIMVNGKKIEFYLNGRLARTKLLIGKPENINANGYFGIGGSFAGKISDFHFFPQSLPFHALRYVYNEESKKPWYANVDSTHL